MALGFEFMDGTRPLLAVKRSVERGNTADVDAEGAWIRNAASGSQIPLERKKVVTLSGRICSQTRPLADNNTYQTRGCKHARNHTLPDVHDQHMHTGVGPL